MRRLAFASLLCLGCATTASPVSAKPASTKAAAPRTSELTVDDVVNLRSVSDVAVSPNGKKIAYVLRTPRSAMDEPGGSRSVIWVVSAKGGDARRMSAPDRSSSSPRWSPDGTWIAFRSGRPGSDGSQIFRISPTGGEAEQLTKSEGRISSFDWSPDGKSIAYLASRVDNDKEKKAKEEGRDWKTTDVKPRFQRLWVFDVAKRKAKALIDRDIHVAHFEWAPDSARLAMQASKRADVDGVMMYSSLYTVERSGKANVLTKPGGKLGDIAWSPKGDRIAYLGAVDIHDPTAGVLFTIPAGGGEPKALTREFEGTGQALEWLDGDEITMLANRGTKTAIYRVSAGDGAMKTVVDSGPVCRRFDIDHRGKTMACVGSTANHPNEVFVGSAKGKSLRRVTRSNPDLAGKKLGAQEVVRWKAKDGLEIEGVVVKPIGFKEGTRYPLAVLVHGGPEGVSLNGWNTAALYPAQLFAARGYVVLMPNYRGSQGRGVAYGKSDQGDLGGKEFTDVIAGIDHLAAKGWVDVDRVGMGGWSYGGYFSGLAATMHSSRFKASVVAAAITNWVSFTGTSEIEHENSLVHWNLWPYDNFELAWSRSPMAHVAKSKTATLVVHGEADTRVPPEQATELYRGLRHFNPKTQILLYPREGHGLGEKAHQKHFAQAFVDWFETHVKG